VHPDFFSVSPNAIYCTVTGNIKIITDPQQAAKPKRPPNSVSLIASSSNKNQQPTHPSLNTHDIHVCETEQRHIYCSMMG